MKHIKIQRISSTLAVLALALVFAGSGPVLAEHGSGDVPPSGSTSPTTTTTTPTTEHSGSPETTHSGGGTTSGSGSNSVPAKTAETETEIQNAEESASLAELHKQGDDMITELRKEHAGDKVKTASEKQKVCEAHKQGLETKFNSIVANSQRTESRISSIMDKAEAFEHSSSTKPAGFDALSASAHEAKDAADASIVTLKDLSPTIDCNGTSVANDVATFKVAAEKTRTDLKAHRDSVKAELKSLETAKPAEGTN